MNGRKIGIIGAGRLGCSLALALKSKGYEIKGVCSKSLESQKFLCNLLEIQYANDLEKTVRNSDIIFITVPDSQVRIVADLISKEVDTTDIGGRCFLHMSGALTSEELYPTRQHGGNTGSLHPIQTIADKESSWKSLEGIFFGFEGCNETKHAAQDIVNSLKGQMLIIEKEDKPLYHAAACILSNYMVTLSYTAGTLLQNIGIDLRTGIKAFIPLMENTLNNIKAYGSQNALTGPISRGDYKVVEEHLRSLSDKQPDAVYLYKALGLATTEVALNKGSIDRNAAENIKRLLE